MKLTYDPRHNIAYIRFQDNGTLVVVDESVGGRTEVPLKH